jgi:Uma2 family endonuclease
MSVLKKNVVLTPEEYLEGELYSEVRHEYVNGRVYAMVGASETHNLISGNLYAALHSHLRGSACRVFMADMKVRIADTFFYPDVMVSCDRADTESYYKTAPILIVEVLSETTGRRDTGEKRLAYQTIASLQEFALVAQDHMEVKIYRRAPEGWNLETCTEGDALRLDSVNLTLPLTAVYDDVWR